MLREPGLRRWEGSKVGNNFLSVPREGFHFLEPRRVASGRRTRTGWPIATARATGLGDPHRDGRAAHSKARKDSYFHFCTRRLAEGAYGSGPGDLRARRIDALDEKVKAFLRHI